MSKPQNSPKWDNNFTNLSPLFASIKGVARDFAGFTQWPQVADYNHICERQKALVHVRSGKKISFIEQAQRRQGSFETSYEPRIYLHGEVLTRAEHWHDFFNMLMWRSFPKAKATLNALQYADMLHQREKRLKQRTIRQNALTQFDECGVIVLASDLAFADLIRQHAWRQLFYVERERLQQALSFIIFGHALFEKALTPYVGLTGKCLIVPVSFERLQGDILYQQQYVDEYLATYFADNSALNPKVLSPLPILGVPGWHAENSREKFYDNTDYFRPRKERALVGNRSLLSLRQAQM